MLVVTKLDRLARSVPDADHEKSPLSIIEIPQVLAGVG